jgi:hypothetical protein
MKPWKDPMMVLAVTVLLGVIGMGVSTLMREDQQMSAEEIALLSAIVGAVAGSSLPRGVWNDSPETRDGHQASPEVPQVAVLEEAPVDAHQLAPTTAPDVAFVGDGPDGLFTVPEGYVGVDPGGEGSGEPDFGAGDGDWFPDEDERDPVER